MAVRPLAPGTSGRKRQRRKRGAPSPCGSEAPLCLLEVVYRMPWLGLHALRLRGFAASFALTSPVRASRLSELPSSPAVGLAALRLLRMPRPLAGPRLGGQFRGRNPWLAPAFPGLAAFPRRWVAPDHPASNAAKCIGACRACTATYGNSIEHSQTIDRRRLLSSLAHLSPASADGYPRGDYVRPSARCG